MLISYSATSPDRTFKASVLVNGVEQPLYRRSDGTFFVASMPGQAYVLRVTNLTNGRIEVVNAVDGRNTLKDEPGNRQSRGVPVYGLGVQTITGWRLNDQQTRQFVFAMLNQSVATQATGSAENVGVIAFAAHRERAFLMQYEMPYYSQPSGIRDTYKELGPIKDYSFRSVGTGMGAIQHDPIAQGIVERDGGDPDLLIIRYDLEEVLRKKGIITPPEADPFPGESTGYGKYMPLG